MSLMMATSSFSIPKLEELAFEVLFKKFVYKATPNTIQFVRDCIDNQLVGRVKKNFREMCIKRLNKIYDLEVYELNFAEKWAKDLPNIYSALDCSLDEYFTKLRITVLFPATDESFSTLLSIIAHRSPKLEELNITFSYNATKRGASNDIFEHPDSSLMQYSRLYCLKSLTISKNDSMWRPRQVGIESPKSILKAVGRYCPSLSKLSLDGMCFMAKDIIDFIMIGEISDVLFPTQFGGWSDSVFDGLRIPPRYLNPLCFTLEELSVTSYNCRDYCCDCWMCDSTSVIAFLLRHLPELQTTDSTSSISSDINNAICLLYEKSKSTEIQQAKFEEACQEAASRIVFKSALTTSPAILPDFLSLKEIDGVPIYDVDSVRAVGLMCPKLESIHFGAPCWVKESDQPAVELKSILHGWSKLDTIKLSDLNSKYVELVLEVFGPALKSLTLSGCKQIDMLLLGTCCVQLEHLSILEQSSVKREEIHPTGWNSDTFLPGLKSLRSHCCLGVWGSLIERKSTLIDLHLNCCHIGTHGHNPHMKWSDVTELWQSLTSLTIRRCTWLTMTRVAELLPQLSRLRLVFLPDSIIKKDPKLSRDIIEQFSSREEPIEIYGVSPCSFRNVCHFKRKR